jgi:hypothetical protein
VFDIEASRTYAVPFYLLLRELLKFGHSRRYQLFVVVQLGPGFELNTAASGACLRHICLAAMIKFNIERRRKFQL